MSEEKESFGSTFFGTIIALILAFIFFSGDPDIVTSIRAYVGKEAGTIPHDYVYIPEEEHAGESDETL